MEWKKKSFNLSLLEHSVNDNYRQTTGNSLISDTNETIIEAKELYTISGRNTFSYFQF